MKPALRSTETAWQPFNNGATLGQRGSEDGNIELDEEHALGARITLERDGRVAPFAITCGIYGLLVHTVFCRDEAESLQKYSAMKERLETILLAAEEHVISQVHDFVEAFPT